MNRVDACANTPSQDKHGPPNERDGTISVVIPFGKVEGNIERCVRSALNQESPPVEVIVIANHAVSLEQATRSLQSLAGDPRLHVVDGSRCRNANEARNLGAEYAQGDWVALLDSDDWWEPTHLSACRRVVASAPGPIELVYGSIVVHTDSGSEILEAHHFSRDVTPENYLLSYFPAQTSSFLVRRKTLTDQPWALNLRRHQDYEWFARVARSHEMSVNAEPTVNVEWLTERRHKAHRDCWRVVEPWRPNVEVQNFQRHHRRLIKSAWRSRDSFVSVLIAKYIYDQIVQYLRNERVGLWRV